MHDSSEGSVGVVGIASLASRVVVRGTAFILRLTRSPRDSLVGHIPLAHRSTALDETLICSWQELAASHPSRLYRCCRAQRLLARCLSSRISGYARCCTTARHTKSDASNRKTAASRCSQTGRQRKLLIDSGQDTWRGLTNIVVWIESH